MNRTEAQQFVNDTFIPLVHKRFEEVYPDTFVKCRTMNSETYNYANGSMYSYYIPIINSLHSLPETPLKYERVIETSDYSYIRKMYEDFKKTDNPMKWLIEFIPLPYR